MEFSENMQMNTKLIIKGKQSNRILLFSFVTLTDTCGMTFPFVEVNSTA